MNAENSQHHRPKLPLSKAEENSIDPSVCDEIQQTVPAHAIGATDPVEVAQINALLAQCPNAATDLAGYRDMAERLLYSAPAARPSSQLAERLHAVVANATSTSARASARVAEGAKRHNVSRQNTTRPPSPLLRRRAGPRTAAQTSSLLLSTNHASTNRGAARPPRALPFGMRRAAGPARRSGRFAGTKSVAVPQLSAAMAMYQLHSEQMPMPAVSSVMPTNVASASLRNPWHFGRFLATAALLALVFMNMALLTQNQELQRTQQMFSTQLTQQGQALILLAAEEPHEIEIFAPDGATSAKADILWNDGLGIAVVYVRDFPQCDPGMKYQIWLTKDGQRRSGGLFSVDSSGMGLLVMPVEHPIDLYDSIGITQEPDGGSPGPTAPPVVRGGI